MAEYPTKVIKKALVGTGGAEKQQIQHMLKILLPGVKLAGEDAPTLGRGHHPRQHAGQPPLIGLSGGNTLPARRSAIMNIAATDDAWMARAIALAIRERVRTPRIRRSRRWSCARAAWWAPASTARPSIAMPRPMPRWKHCAPPGTKWAT
jgi:hypothetical protein